MKNGYKRRSFPYTLQRGYRKSMFRGELSIWSPSKRKQITKCLTVVKRVNPLELENENNRDRILKTRLVTLSVLTLEFNEDYVTFSLSTFSSFTTVFTFNLYLFYNYLLSLEGFAGGSSIVLPNEPSLP